MTESLHDEIDKLAQDVESTIQTGKEINERFEDAFDPKYRRIQEAEKVDIFS